MADSAASVIDVTASFQLLNSLARHVVHTGKMEGGGMSERHHATFKKGPQQGVVAGFKARAVLLSRRLGHSRKVYHEEPMPKCLCRVLHAKLLLLPLSCDRCASLRIDKVARRQPISSRSISVATCVFEFCCQLFAFFRLV